MKVHLNGMKISVNILRLIAMNQVKRQEIQNRNRKNSVLHFRWSEKSVNSTYMSMYSFTNGTRVPLTDIHFLYSSKPPWTMHLMCEWYGICFPVSIVCTSTRNRHGNGTSPAHASRLFSRETFIALDAVGDTLFLWFLNSFGRNFVIFKLEFPAICAAYSLWKCGQSSCWIEDVRAFDHLKRKREIIIRVKHSKFHQFHLNWQHNLAAVCRC